MIINILSIDIEHQQGYNKKSDKAYYERAAALGYGQSMSAIGSIYLIINEKEEARRWFNKAVSAGYEPARKQLKLLNFSQSGSWFDLIK